VGVEEKEMSNKKIFIPSSGPDDWKSFLADPEKHWARGYSARIIAHCWEDAQGFPPEILKVLKQSPALQDIEPLLIFPLGCLPCETCFSILPRKVSLVSLAGC
jgi:hypothetical protein